MFFSADPGTVTHGIQLALAPVFLLTAVAAMIGAVTGRLARIIDRARVLEERLEAGHYPPDATDHAATRAQAELHDLRTRGWLVNVCIALLTLCALLIGLTIVTLFLGETTGLEFLRLPTLCFLGGVICFLLALLCFLAETLLATRILRFGQGGLRRPKKMNQSNRTI